MRIYSVKFLRIQKILDSSRSYDTIEKYMAKEQQYRFEFPEHVVASFPQETPEPLSPHERETLSRSITLLKTYIPKLRSTLNALSKQRLAGALSINKTGADFDGTKFHREKIQPLEIMLTETESLIQSLTDTLENYPSRNRKAELTIAAGTLLSNLKKMYP